MSYYYGLRGWLEVGPEHFKKIVKLILAAQQAAEPETNRWHYLRAWCWNEEQVGWENYIFYGADVKPEGLQYLDEMISEILRHGFRVHGYFHAQGEDLAKNYTFRVFKGVLTIEESQPMFESDYEEGMDD